MAGNLHDQRVHPLVCQKELVVIPGSVQHPLVPEHGTERLHLRRVDPLNRALYGRAFQGFADELAVEDLAQLDRRHEGAVLRIDLDQVLLGELDQRLADRRARHAKPLRQLLFRQHAARQQPARDDLATQQGANLSGDGLTAHGHVVATRSRLVL